jgi:hypothetical protein
MVQVLSRNLTVMTEENHAEGYLSHYIRTQRRYFVQGLQNTKRPPATQCVPAFDEMSNALHVLCRASGSEQSVSATGRQFIRLVNGAKKQYGVES